MGFKKYYVYKILSSPTPIDSYGINFIKVRGVSSSGDVSEDLLFSDEHILNNICIGYWGRRNDKLRKRVLGKRF